MVGVKGQPFLVVYHFPAVYKLTCLRTQYFSIHNISYIIHIATVESTGKYTTPALHVSKH